MDKQKIKINKTKVWKLLRHVDEGKFAIPKLQREFVWDGPKAARLLDSILNYMPIGTIMIWETLKAHRLYLRQRYHVLPPFNDRNSKVWFLVDGQQRVSVIHHVREGGKLENARGNEIDFRRVVFSLEHQEDGQQIRYRKPVKGQYISLSDILYPQWQHRISYLKQSERAKVQKCRDLLLNYPMYFMFVQSKIAEIRECFLRINTQGMKITTADAIFTRAEDLELRDIIHEVKQHLDEPFKDMPEMPILFSLAAVRGGTEARGEALRQVINRLQKEVNHNRKLRKSLTYDWSRLVKCFGKSIDYLRENFFVLNRDFLYSDYIISILSLFFFWNERGPSARQKDQIRKWFWATTVGSRYTGQKFLRCLPEDIRFFKRLAVKGNSIFKYSPQVEQIDVRRSLYGSRAGITSAFYCLLFIQRPVSIMDDGLNVIPIERYSTSANRKDRHHIFPRSVLRDVGIPVNQFNSICNICMLTAEENNEIGARLPRSYLGEVYETGTYFKAKMKRHLIPVHDDSGIWMCDIKKGFNRFIKERSKMICEVLENEAGIRLFRRDID